MASKFAEELFESLKPVVLRNAVIKTQATTRIDLAMLKVSQVLGHAQHRNHEHNPGACDGCAELEKVVERLKIW